MKPCTGLLITLTLCLLSAGEAVAQRTYPASRTLPDDVVWMREVYRTLDLTQDTNGALYYPVEPQDGRTNLFTALFRLLAQKKITAYEYQLDGTERLTKENAVTFREVLDRFQIYYELKPSKSRRDSVISIHNSDIPSADVLSYFIKEVWYFDQRTSTYGSVVTAVCPVLHRSETFSSERVKQPMFWVDYKEAAPYLSQNAVATSNLNNAAIGTWDDFFASRLYQGDIYKVTNLQNRTLAQYCPTDSALTREQRRIEQEILDFEKRLYGTDLAEDEAAEAADSLGTSPVKVKRSNSKKPGQTAGKASAHKSKASASASGSGKSQSSAPKASVRRQRR